MIWKGKHMKRAYIITGIVILASFIMVHMFRETSRLTGAGLVAELGQGWLGILWLGLLFIILLLILTERERKKSPFRP